MKTHRNKTPGQGWLRRLVRFFRRRAICKKWNQDLEWIREQAGDDRDEAFKWGQLVWQEIAMWVQIGSRVDADEFEWLCSRRGFNGVQRQYLSDMLALVRLRGFEPNNAI
jgi:hypothetical protein